MKKLHKTVTLSLIILALIFSGCSNTNITKTKETTTKVIDKDINFTVTKENNPKFLEEPKDEELKFFDSIENALKCCNIDMYEIENFNKNDIIKIIGNNESLTIFLLQNKEYRIILMFLCKSAQIIKYNYDYLIIY